MKLLKSLFLVCVLVGMGTGCATTKQIVTFPDQSKPLSDANKSRIYVISGVAGGGSPMTVWDGTEKIGSMGPYGYLCWERESGNALIRAKLPMSIMGVLSLKCEKGQTYYVRQGTKGARCTLNVLSRSEGVKQLAKSKPPRLK